MTTSGNNGVTVVEIRNPVTHEPRGSTRMYTDYEVCIKTCNKAFIIPQSYVRRRYSDFVWLRKWLLKNNGNFMSRKLAKLPRKKFVDRFNPDFLKERMSGLETFLNSVILHNVFLSDKALHLFLQSGMTVKSIDDFLLGKDSFQHSLFDDDSDAQLPGERGFFPERTIPDSVESDSSVSSLTGSFDEVDTGDLNSTESENTLNSRLSAALD